MSKTFKSALGTTELEVVKYSDSIGALFIRSEDGEDLAGFYFDQTSVPAQAIAVLEAAGVAESSDAGVAANYLRLQISEQERATAEAKEQAELEAEALELMNVRLDAAGNPKHLTKETVDPIALEAWLAVAYRAREMRAEK